MQIAALAEGLSGRALRKLPFQAHAFFVQVRKAQRLPVVRKTPAAQLLRGLVWFGLFGPVEFDHEVLLVLCVVLFWSI